MTTQPCNTLAKGSLWDSKVISTKGEKTHLFDEIISDTLLLLTKQFGSPNFRISRRDKRNLYICCSSEVERVSLKTKTCSFFIKATMKESGMVCIDECITEHNCLSTCRSKLSRTKNPKLHILKQCGEGTYIYTIYIYIYHCI